MAVLTEYVPCMSLREALTRQLTRGPVAGIPLPLQGLQMHHSAGVPGTLGSPSSPQLHLQLPHLHLHLPASPHSSACSMLPPSPSVGCNTHSPRSYQAMYATSGLATRMSRNSRPTSQASLRSSFRSSAHTRSSRSSRHSRQSRQSQVSNLLPSRSSFNTIIESPSRGLPQTRLYPHQERATPPSMPLIKNILQQVGLTWGRQGDRRRQIQRLWGGVVMQRLRQGGSWGRSGHRSSRVTGVQSGGGGGSGQGEAWVCSD